MDVLSAVRSTINSENSGENVGIQEREGRGMEMYSPFFYFLGLAVALYFGLYVVFAVLGPALFGSRPYYPFNPYPYGRSLKSTHEKEKPDMEMLTSKVMSSIEKDQ